MIEKYTVTICIREKGLSAKERFQQEIVEHGLFEGIDVSGIKLIEKDVLLLDPEDLKSVDTIIHCAANVKFSAHIDILKEENVSALKKIHRLSEGKKFFHISTCYVHPKNSDKAEKIPAGLVPSDFICNYAYTKYLAEQYLYDKPNVTIIRLSCVGAPVETLTPMRGGAHLAILELLERSTLPDVWFPENLVFSVVPVDSVCNAIIKQLEAKPETLQILQYSAPKDSKTYNISASELSKYKKPNVMIWNKVKYSIFEDWMKFFYWFIPTILKKILDSNIIISHVARNISFETSIVLPDLSPEEYIDLTRAYTKKLVKLKPSKLSVMPFLYWVLRILKEGVLWLVGPMWIDRDEILN